MSLDKAKLPSLKDKIRERAEDTNEEKNDVKKVEVEVKKGRRLNK